MSLNSLGLGMFAEVNNFFAVCKKLREVVTKKPEVKYKTINLNDIASLTDCLETTVNAIDQKLQKVETRISALENNILFFLKGANSALENSALEKQNGAVGNEIQEQGEEQPLKRRRGRRAIKDVTVPVD